MSEFTKYDIFCGLIKLVHYVQKQDKQKANKKTPNLVGLDDFFWCERWDLNPHDVTHLPLKQARLPFRHIRKFNFTSIIVQHFQAFVNIFLRFFIKFFVLVDLLDILPL